MLLPAVAVICGMFQLAPVKQPSIDSIARQVVASVSPGLGLVVVHKGAIVHAGTYGVADRATKQAFTFDTPIYVASLGKMFTAFGVLKLADEGKLSIDQKLADFLPDVPAYARSITLRQMLTHTSGLIDHTDVGGDHRTYSITDVLTILQHADSLQFAPGDKSSYSNSAYVLLARVIENVSGIKYEKYVHDNFFVPAGMTNARVITQPQDVPASRAIGYALKDNQFTPDDYAAAPNSATGDGDIYMTLNDLYKWGIALRSGKFLKPETLRLASQATIKNNGKPTEWGMGWLAEFHGKKDKLAGKWYVASIGILKGFWASFKWYQQDDLMIMWIANTDSGQVLDSLQPIAPMLLLPE